jgi:ubiquinol-cytochrome c reductase iron-sulfur subunit
MAVKDLSKRKFLITCVKGLSAFGVVFGLWPFFSSMQPSRKVEDASKPITVGLEDLQPNDVKKVLWRGMPIYIIKRTDDQVNQLETYTKMLSDPSSVNSEQPTFAMNPYRSKRKDILVVVAVCTHLGCSPTYKPKKSSVDNAWEGGFFCACHGSKFDLSGRVYKGVPAPTNLLIPPYHFVNEDTLIIGSEGSA